MEVVPGGSGRQLITLREEEKGSGFRSVFSECSARDPFRILLDTDTGPDLEKNSEI